MTQTGLIKPGYQTTEFWATLVTLVIGGLVTLGFLPKEPGDHLLALALWAITLIMPATAYNYGRAAIKSAAAKLTGDTKPGYKTTEFWISVVTIAIGSLVTLGYLPKEQGDHLLALAIFIIMSVVPVVAYSYGRSAIKSAALSSGP